MSPSDNSVGSVEQEQPKLFGQCNALYELMDSNSQPGLSDTDAPDDSIRVWRGRLLESCESVGIPRGAHTRVLSSLRNLGCIEQTARGFRGTALSEFILHYPPTVEVWERIVKSTARDLTAPPSSDRLTAEVRDIQKRLGGIDLILALQNLDGRVTKLEALLSKIEAEPQEDSTKAQ